MGLEALALSASIVAILASLFKVLRDYKSHTDNSSITIKIGDHTVKLETTKPADLDRIIEALKEQKVEAPEKSDKTESGHSDVKQ